MIYTICKGQHYTINRSLSSIHLGTRSMIRVVRFTDSCLYQLTDPSCVDDINKLFGFSYGRHQSNSVRFGWRCKAGNLALFAYCKKDGKTIVKKVIDVKPNLFYTCEIYVGMGYVRFTVNDKDVFVTIDYNPSIGYSLLPYFGGNCPAPTDVKIMINIL
jgi:hypothetical protein